MVTWESIFPSPVMRSNIGREFTAEELKFFRRLQETPHPNIANTRSEDTQVLEAPEMESLRAIIQDHINRYAWRAISADPKFTFYITQSWTNYTRPSEAHHRHMHTNSLISGSLYIQAKNDVDGICFHRNSAAHVQILVSNEHLNEYNAPVQCFSVGTGDLVLFPSSLVHSVEQTTGDHLRISLAFNAFVKGELGAPDRLNNLTL